MRYSAFKMYYGRFQYFRHFLRTIIICCHTFVVNGISHIQVEKFGKKIWKNLEKKYEILEKVLEGDIGYTFSES